MLSLEDLCHQVTDLLEEFNGLCNIRKDEWRQTGLSLRHNSLKNLKPQLQKRSRQYAFLLLSNYNLMERRRKLVTSVSKRKALASPKGLHVQTSFTTLKVEEKINVPTSKGSVLPNPKLHNSLWKKL